jgi:hypothetical protein
VDDPVLDMHRGGERRFDRRALVALAGTVAGHGRGETLDRAVARAIDAGAAKLAH